jgi:signal transduction histidine kinase
MDAKKSHLEITIGYDADGRYVTVSNSGAAMQSGTKGIGLANLDERLRLLCGGRLETVRTDTPTFYLHLGACHENTDRR